MSYMNNIIITLVSVRMTLGGPDHTCAGQVDFG